MQGKNRRGWTQKLFGSVAPRTTDNPCIWMHAVSVGEVNLLAPLIARLQKERPNLEVVISATTETGFDLANKKFPEHFVFFCPLDFTWAIRRVLKRLRPSLLALAELELWPNLIGCTRSAGIPVAVVNGRLSANSFKGYRRLIALVRPSFEKLSLVAASNQTYADRFCELGCRPDKTIVTGSVKYDGIESDRNNQRTQALSELAGIKPDDQVFVAGSTQVEEDLIAASVYQQLCKSMNLRLILVPRHPERCRSLANQLNQMGIPTVFRSQLRDVGDRSTTGDESVSVVDLNRFTKANAVRPVLIVDVIGELGAWWGCADAAYVGGSMGPRGGQNMIEPAAYGVPVSFGPNTENFRDVVEELLNHNAATVVQDENSLREFLVQALGDRQWAAGMSHRCQQVVLSHAGASQKTVESLCKLIADAQGEFGLESGAAATVAA